MLQYVISSDINLNSSVLPDNIVVMHCQILRTDLGLDHNSNGKYLKSHSVEVRCNLLITIFGSQS